MGALQAIYPAAGLRQVERMTRSLAQRRDELTGATVAIGFDVLARRRSSRDEARQWLDDQVPDLERAGPRALGVLYASLEQLGHAPEAAAWVDRAVTSGQVTPERWPDLSNAVAWSALQRGHPEAGLVWARAAVAGRPEEANFLDTLGQILLAQGEYAEAEAVLRQALAAQQRTSTRVALARTLAAQGQHAAAAVEAEEALAEHTGPWPGDAPGAQQVRSWMQEWRDSSGAAPASQRAAASATVLGSE